MHRIRRDFIATAVAMATTFALPHWMHAAQQRHGMKRHIVTLSFDDGFKKWPCQSSPNSPAAMGRKLQ